MGSLVSLGAVSASAGAAVNTVYVSTGGSDANTCASPATACATINHAIAVAVPGDTVKVAAGTYNQTVDISKAVQVVGANPASTVINGAGLDPNSVPATAGTYGVVFVGTTGGASSLSGFTVTNPFPFAVTSGEPEIVALADQSATDSVTITNDVISEGNSDANDGTDFPIGVDSFKNTATTTISHDTIKGTFQGALLEDNGPVSFSHNTVKSLISNTFTDNTTTPPTVTTYPGEGVFFLSDLAGSITGQDAAKNQFSNYAGWGIILEAGYNNGNCSAPNPPCNGSIAGSVTKNHLALGAASTTVTGGGNPPSSTPVSGIDLDAAFNGNNLTATVSNNSGFVTSPDKAITQEATNGATISVSGSGNKVKVKP